MVRPLEDDIFRGKLVRLCAEDPKIIAQHFSRWSLDTEFQRLEDSYPTRALSAKAIQDWLEKEQTKENNLFFSIRTLKEDRLVGEIGLDGIQYNHGDAFLGIGLGDREDWGKGYGSDAMRLILRYAFHELNLYRVSLNVFEYNPRAIHAYEKLGFVHEGRVRQFLNREGKRWDLLYMGITRQAWEKSLVD
jgi:RimJ/RimL family protein N-acetyltransferase